MTLNYVSINKVIYPLHCHPDWEILYYTQGEGYLAASDKNYPFEKGTIMLIPPNTPHGTFSEKGSVNISMGGNFNGLFMGDSIITLSDNISEDGLKLVKLIFANRYSNTDYLSALCSAYVHFILQNISPKSRIHKSVGKIISNITEAFFEPDFDLTPLMNQTGYAEDYIRAQFKNITGVTPVAYLTKMRIDHAKKLFDIYGDNITVTEAAYACGFADPVYFSKRFKSEIGVSPDIYKKTSKKPML